MLAFYTDFFGFLSAGMVSAATMDAARDTASRLLRSRLNRLAIAVGRTKAPKETQEVSSVATTQSAAVRPRAYTATECQKPELKSDERCDWYYDPMSGSQPGDTSEGAPAKK